jgi:hypothetical protein
VSAPVQASARLRWASLVLLFLLPFFLRAHGIEHGLPRNYVPDTHIVKNALGMAATKNLVPRAGEFSAYPNLLPYCLLPMYVAWYAEGRVAGDWQGSGEFGVHVQLHPEGAHEIARWLVLLFGTLTPWVVARAARAAGLASGALVAGFLVATSLLHLQLSTHERPWVPMSFFIALAMWASIRAATSTSPRALVLATLAASLAFATHPAGLFALGLPGLAWLQSPIGWRGRDLRSRLSTAVLCGVLFAALALVVGYPYLVVHGRTPASAEIGGGAADVNLGAMSAVLRFRWATFERLSMVFLGYEPVLLALGLAGLWPAVRRQATRGPTLWLLAWSGWFLFYWADHARYLVPSVLGLALPAAIAAEWLLRRRAGRIALVLALGFTLIQATRLGVLLGRPDTRAEAEVRLAELAPGNRVAIDRYGPEVDLSAPALALLGELRERRGMALGRREQTRAELLAAGRSDLVAPGIDAVSLGDLFEFDERAERFAPWPGIGAAGESTDELLRRLGITHLLLVERRPGENGSLAASLVQGREPIWTIDPSAGSGTSEAFLPTEMDFPLTGLWTVERPGPRLELYELGR